MCGGQKYENSVISFQVFHDPKTALKNFIKNWTETYPFSKYLLDQLKTCYFSHGHSKTSHLAEQQKEPLNFILWWFLILLQALCLPLPHIAPAQMC